MPDTFAFVDSVSASPTTRLDLNDGSTWGLNYDGTSFPPPPLRRAYARTLLVDGARIPAAAYDNRVLRVRLDLKTASVDTAATQLQSLTRELDRPANILKWQVTGATSPVFFRTFRTPADAITEHPGTGTFREVSLEIEAEPFALGLPVHVGQLNSNPRFDTNITDWTGANGATLSHNTTASLVHEGTGSMKITPDGVNAQANAHTSNYAVTAGSWVYGEAWVLMPAGWSDVRFALDFVDSGFVSTGSDIGIQAAPAAGEWVQVTTMVLAPANTAWVRGRIRIANTPAATDVAYVDQAYLVLASTVGNDPAASTNGCYFDIASVQGDVETPAIIKFRASHLTGKGPTALAGRRRGTPASMPFVFQAESAAMGTDTSVQANDAAMSGASNNYIRTTFATATAMTTRATFTIPPISGVDARGTYRVFARYRKGTAADVITMRWTTTGPTVTTAAGTTNRRWIDLSGVDNLLQLPVGPDPEWQGYSGVALPVGETSFALQAARVSGSGNLDIDCVLLMPADDWLMISDLAQAGDQVVLDAVRQAVTARTSGGITAYSTATGHAGGWPMLAPNQTNRLAVLLNAASTSANDTIGDTFGVAVEYYPRYLYLRPAAS